MFHKSHINELSQKYILNIGSQRSVHSYSSSSGNGEYHGRYDGRNTFIQISSTVNFCYVPFQCEMTFKIDVFSPIFGLRIDINRNINAST